MHSGAEMLHIQNNAINQTNKIYFNVLYLYLYLVTLFRDWCFLYVAYFAVAKLARLGSLFAVRSQLGSHV